MRWKITNSVNEWFTLRIKAFDNVTKNSVRVGQPLLHAHPLRQDAADYLGKAVILPRLRRGAPVYAAKEVHDLPRALLYAQLRVSRHRLLS